MDNKPLEKEAESFIRSQLLRSGFKVHDLSFDEKGSDLMITKKDTKHKLKYVTIQCKGRRLSKRGSSIKIPAMHVEENFVLFIYIINEKENQSLLVFFPSDIKTWKVNQNNEYVLFLSESKLQMDEIRRQIFDKNHASKIHELLDNAEPKDYTSIFVDGIFLEKAINRTLQLYSSIYPEKKFIKPDFKTLIGYILEAYNKYKTEKKIINCYLFMSNSFSLQHRIKIGYDNQKFTSKDGNIVRIFINKTDEIISFEVLEEIERLTNNTNILLVANDRAYEYDLKKLKRNGFDMIIIRFNMHDGNDMQSNFRWADVSWPVGRSLGLKLHEL